MDTLNADNFPIDLFNTDHYGVITTLICQGLFNQNSHATLKQHLIKKHHSIFIDRVIIKENNTNTLITDPTRIKKVVNEHFQKCPSSKNNPDKVIPPTWSSYYQPIEIIDPHIYQNLMSPPSDNEWTIILSALLKDKASGPSGILNEMLQHLGPCMRSLIFDFISQCLNLADTSDEWHLAHVYPIPNPRRENVI
ncbi:hypothetical protein C1645_837654 [Glomus cerebriforme]|uniref:Uncharacterized protein n=1 Tax=Glomus cerebriforme TaxID=658196 RepID=A0A397S3P4_9GLOM|nr:hypothetical protein C1645_837654 [Glomus cerebriforme]